VDSPVRYGDYKRSHQLKAEDDYVEVYTESEYAVPLEHGHSQQAPSGVYGPAAQSAKVKYGLERMK